MKSLQQNLLQIELPISLLDTWNTTMTLTAQSIKCPIASILRIVDDELVVVAVNEGVPDAFEVSTKTKTANFYHSEVIEGLKRVKFADANKVARWSRIIGDNEITAYMGLPLKDPNNEIWGVVCVMDFKPNTFGDNGEKLLKDVKDIVERDLFFFQSSDEKKSRDDKSPLPRRSTLIGNLTEDSSYKHIFQIAQIALLILDENLVFVECNLMAVKTFRRKKEEIIGSTPIDFSPEYQPGGTPSSILANLDSASALEGQEQRFDWMMIKGDGSDLPVEVSLSAFTKDNKTFILAVVKDLTALKIRENELIDSKERFKKLYSQSADGIIIHHPKKGFADCNDAAVKLLDYKTKADLKTKFLWDLSPKKQQGGEDSKGLAKTMDNACLDNGMNRFEWLLKKKNGEEFWVELVQTKISFFDKDYIHIVLRDINERKKNQEALSRQKEQLEGMVRERTRELQENEEKLISRYEELKLALKDLGETHEKLIESEKMAALGTLSAGVGHEINNPLNFIKGGITGLSMFLEDNYEQLDDEVSKFIEIIKEGVERSEAIVTSLGHFSRTSKSMDESCSVNKILDNCLTILQNKFKFRIEVIKEYNGTPIVRGNEGRLHQSFLNILTNAEQAIVDKGEIRISTSASENQVEVAVTDSGAGIEQEHLINIMDPFFTTKSPGVGTGLGLSITYNIIKEHGGDIVVKSELEKGTTVKLVLPRWIDES